MISPLLSRTLAAAFALFAVAAGVGAAAHLGEPWLRTVARVVFALVLLEMAALAWRWPRNRPRRFRERVSRLLEAMGNPSRHLEMAESSPQVGLAVAFVDDWSAASRERGRLPEGALSAAELAVLDDLGRVLEHLRPSLLALGDRPVAELQAEESWRLLVIAAERARAAWLELQAQG